MGWTLRVGSALTDFLRRLGKSELDYQLRNSLEAWRKDPTQFFRIFRELEEAVAKRHLGYRARFEENIEKIDNTHPLKYGYYPTPLVGRLLRVLYHSQPEGFSILRLRPVRLPPAADREPLFSRAFTVFLPRVQLTSPEAVQDELKAKDRQLRKAQADLHQQERKIERLKKKVEQLELEGRVEQLKKEVDRLELEERLGQLVGRYVAAMVINLEVSMGPQSVALDFISNKERKSWLPWIQHAPSHLGHQGIINYLEQFHAERCEAHPSDVVEAFQFGLHFPATYKAPEGTILGIDVGGTAIKCALFEVARVQEKKRQRLKVGAMAEQQKEMRTAPPNTRHDGARGFASWVIGSLPDDWPLGTLLAVGVAWPGAVHDGKTVAATSGIIGRFQGCENWLDVEPRKLHDLDIRQAFRHAFEKLFESMGITSKSPFVTLLNDGDADIKSTENETVASNPSDAVSLILKAGTGTACGVYIGERQVDLLAEAGKMVINLEPRYLTRPFPFGTLNNYCSKKTLPAIAEALGWQPPPGTPDLDAREVGYFLEDEVSPDAKKIREQIGRELVFKRFADQFDGPTAMRHKKTLEMFFHEPDNAWLRLAERRVLQLEEAASALPGEPNAQAIAHECAKIAGRQLGDALALLVSVFRGRTIRLAGGALSGATGHHVSQHACEVLREVYGFEVETKSNSQPSEIDAHALAEVKQIRVIQPTDQHSQPDRPAGPLGAARAALEGLVRDIKGRALREVRSEINDLPSRGDLSKSIQLEEFAPPDSPLEVAEVQQLIETFMATVGITRAPTSAYFIFDRSEGTIGGGGLGYLRREEP